MNMLNVKFGRYISSFLLPVMILFTLNSAFADNCQLTSIQWYIFNGKDVVGTTNDTAKGKQTDSYDYTPYGRGTMLSSEAGGRWPVARGRRPVTGGQWSVAGKGGEQTEILRSNNLSSKIQPCRAEATSEGGNLTQLRQGFRLRKATPGQASGQAFNINNNPFQYSGYYLDSISGLYYLNARYYSPELMRFISRDSYDLPNRYAYGNGEPVSQVDPTGHNSWLIAMFHKDLTSTLLGIGSLALGIGITIASGGVDAPLGWGIASAVVGSVGQLTDEGLVDSGTIKHGSLADEAITWGSFAASIALGAKGCYETAKSTIVSRRSFEENFANSTLRILSGDGDTSYTESDRYVARKFIEWRNAKFSGFAEAQGSQKVEAEQAIEGFSTIVNDNPHFQKVLRSFKKLDSTAIRLAKIDKLTSHIISSIDWPIADRKLGTEATLQAFYANFLPDDPDYYPNAQP